MKRFFATYFSVLVVAFSLVVFLHETYSSDQEHLTVDLEDLVTHTEDFRDMKIRTKGTVQFWASIYMYEDFWLASDTQGRYAIPVVVKNAGLSPPSENASIEVWGIIEYCELEGGFAYLDTTSWEPAEKIVSGTGTVRFLDFEGGFYGIVSDDGKHYDPLSLDSEFRVDGMPVRFEVRILQDVGSCHMWGEVVSIPHIEKLN